MPNLSADFAARTGDPGRAGSCSMFRVFRVFRGPLGGEIRRSCSTFRVFRVFRGPLASLRDHLSASASICANLRRSADCPCAHWPFVLFLKKAVSRFRHVRKGKPRQDKEIGLLGIVKCVSAEPCATVRRPRGATKQ